MRLSQFAQDALLSEIYTLEDIDPSELTVAEKNILDAARRYDRERDDMKDNSSECVEANS